MKFILKSFGVFAIAILWGLVILAVVALAGLFHKTAMVILAIMAVFMYVKMCDVYG